MVKVILAGVLGKMGRTVSSRAAETEGVQIVAGVDIQEDPDYSPGFPIYPSFSDVKESADVVIDFSSPALLGSLLHFCRERGLGAVIAATGYGDADRASIHAASQEIPVFFSANLSVGVNLLRYLAREAARILGTSSDIEIVERHHNQKVDAPSGTALALADAVQEELPGSMEVVYARHERHEKRAPNEIGIHSVRGGSIVGDHDVMFIRPDEEVVLTHRAYSKKIFADGALQAAVFLAKQAPGMYDMGNLIEDRDLLGTD
ncbi:MAG: 4-hydroxy-tetrahydrodipicolinate reductase [Clostridia bacterium]|nr:4-hydroxy-tetrahydrodipicolinate reductase [Clostridia bacterium]